MVRTSECQCQSRKSPGFDPQSSEGSRGPPELVQHFVYRRGVLIGARALHVLNLIWFGCIALLSHWKMGVISSFKRFLLAFSSIEEGGVEYPVV